MPCRNMGSWNLKTLENAIYLIRNQVCCDSDAAVIANSIFEYSNGFKSWTLNAKVCANFLDPGTVTGAEVAYVQASSLAPT